MAVLQSQPLGCYNNIRGCRASAQIWSQTHVMTLKKVLAVTKTLFQMILKRQGNPICHGGDRAGSTGHIFGAWNFHEPSLNRVRVHAVSLSAPHPRCRGPGTRGLVLWFLVQHLLLNVTFNLIEVVLVSCKSFRNTVPVERCVWLGDRAVTGGLDSLG